MQREETHGHWANANAKLMLMIKYHVRLDINLSLISHQCWVSFSDIICCSRNLTKSLTQVRQVLHHRVTFSISASWARKGLQSTLSSVVHLNNCQKPSIHLHVWVHPSQEKRLLSWEINSQAERLSCHFTTQIFSLLTSLVRVHFQEQHRSLPLSSNHPEK